MNLEHAFPRQNQFWEGKDFDILKFVYAPGRNIIPYWLLTL